MKINNNIPAYRFQGYTDAWKLRRFSELAEIRRGLTYSPTSINKEGVRVLRSSNIDEDTFTFGEDDVFVDKWVVKIPLVKEGDILITAANGSSRLVGKHAIIKDLPANSAIHGGFMLLASCRNPEFVNSLMSSAWYTKFINLYVAGGNGAIGNLNKNDLDEQNVLVPNPKEQSAIGTFFSTLDRHITLHQRKLDTLKEQKKSYLKLLFPAKGQTKPALRFQGFEDDWEEVKLGELCDIRTGKLDANAMVENGEYDFYTSGIKKYRIDVAEFEGPAITIAGNGATVGYMHLADGKFNAYQRTYVLTNFKVDRRYIFSEIAKKLPIKIQQEARTGNIPYIVLSMLTELSISLPSLPEQEAIGTFFQTLDQEISQVEDKLASLKEMKKTLLRKLFV
ncbi:restriction endonuclease subunit S [Streptococcus suis]|uniref:restriction endonuclease subunit S n=1 Tax=Streptococcus suis TaxID=1307 RepID=UPI0024128C27|nr:restriction endonuclease subunit S [Streptococcus suis]MDG4523015.1 restriction endonuclease subunit S [Streptococcus suis]